MISNGAGSWWWVSSCDKPSYEVSTEEYKLTNHKFKYPGVTTWNDVTITVVDVDKTAKGLYEALKHGGYAPTKSDKINDGMEKSNMSEMLKSIGSEPSNAGSFQILQLDDEGTAIETWTLVNPFIKSTNFGSLDYSSDDLVKLELVISYDYAELT